MHFQLNNNKKFLTVFLGHPRFFNQLSCGLDVVSLAGTKQYKIIGILFYLLFYLWWCAGEWLTATANTNMFTYEIAPVFILMEHECLKVSNTRCTSPFLFIKNKRLFISFEGFSALQKNAMICSQMAMLPSAHPVGWCMLQPSVWRTFFKIQTSWVGCDSPLLTIMAVCRISNFKKMAPKDNSYLQKAVLPGQITQQNSLQRAGAP
jgi:hypothetical protein